MSLVDQYEISNANTAFALGVSTIDRIAQSFAGNGQRLYSASFVAANSFGAIGTVVCKLYAHTATFGSTGKPTGLA